MTGFGNAHTERSDHSIAVEIRTVNSRHLKLSVRTTDGYGAFDARIERVVRQHVRRGTVYVNVRIRHINAADDYRINSDVLEVYLDELQKLASKRGLDEVLRLEGLASLPGVVEELSRDAREPDAIWPLVEETLVTALKNLSAMRQQEGDALAADLKSQCDTAAESLDRIAARAPLATQAYRERLIDRVGEVLAGFQVKLEPQDVVREVCLFADRADISEEVVRLRSHLDQFRQSTGVAQSAGRKLEFICQEMGRETNTIGSKANDAEISAEVVEIKTALERIREQIQNVE
jgi:uncharacterized protein (TIGR00255 family)